MKRNYKKKAQAGTKKYKTDQLTDVQPFNPQMANLEEPLPPDWNYTQVRDLGMKDNPYLTGFNAAAEGVTGLANVIQNNRLKKKEQFNIMQSLQPQYYQNMEAEGLNNTPAYTQFGGTGKTPAFNAGFAFDSGSADGGSGGIIPKEDLMKGIDHDAFYGEISIHQAGGKAGGKYFVMRPYGGGPLTAEGAKEMLRDDSAHGHKLTAKQKRYFGWIAGGKKHPKKQHGGMASHSSMSAAHVVARSLHTRPIRHDESAEEKPKIITLVMPPDIVYTKRQGRTAVKKKQMGGESMSSYKMGQEVDLTDAQIKELKKQGYDCEPVKTETKIEKKTKPNKFSIVKK